MNRHTAPRKIVMAAYLLPSLILFVFIVIAPVIAALYYSTFNWPGGTVMTYIGLENYKTMLHDALFWSSFSNNIYLVVVCIVGQIGLAFIFALLLSSKLVKGKGFHRAVAYFPVTLSAVVVGFVWTMMYDYRYGIINVLFKSMGLTSMVRPWLSDVPTIMLVVSLPLVWQYIGMYLVIILAAMTSISPEVLEMAELDGAGPVRRALHITFPLIKNTLIICLMLCISGNMKAFDHIYAMTRGGPGYASSVMALYSYNVSFMQMNMGYGTTLSIGILVLSIVLVGGSRALLTSLTKERDVV